MKLQEKTQLEGIARHEVFNRNLSLLRDDIGALLNSAYATTEKIKKMIGIYSEDYIAELETKVKELKVAVDAYEQSIVSASFGNVARFDFDSMKDASYPNPQDPRYGEVLPYLSVNTSGGYLEMPADDRTYVSPQKIQIFTTGSADTASLCTLNSAKGYAVSSSSTSPVFHMLIDFNNSIAPVETIYKYVNSVFINSVGRNEVQVESIVYQRSGGSQSYSLNTVFSGKRFLDTAKEQCSRLTVTFTLKNPKITNNAYGGSVSNMAKYLLDNPGTFENIPHNPSNNGIFYIYEINFASILPYLREVKNQGIWWSPMIDTGLSTVYSCRVSGEELSTNAVKNFYLLNQYLNASDQIVGVSGVLPLRVNEGATITSLRFVEESGTVDIDGVATPYCFYGEVAFPWCEVTGILDSTALFFTGYHAEYHRIYVLTEEFDHTKDYAAVCSYASANGSLVPISNQMFQELDIVVGFDVSNLVKLNGLFEEGDSGDSYLRVELDDSINPESVVVEKYSGYENGVPVISNLAPTYTAEDIVVRGRIMYIPCNLETYPYLANMYFHIVAEYSTPIRISNDCMNYYSYSGDIIVNKEMIPEDAVKCVSQICVVVKSQNGTTPLFSADYVELRTDRELKIIRQSAGSTE